MQLPFDPTSGYHDYRFDRLPGSVKFYAEPFAIPGALLEMVARLLLMHVVAAVIVVGSLTTLARAR
jgi:hypothetical protein